MINKITVLQSIKNQKYTKLYLITISILILSILLVFKFQNYINKTAIDELKNNVINRKLELVYINNDNSSINDLINKIKKIETIIDLYPIYPTVSCDYNENYKIFLQYENILELPKTINKRKLEDSNNEIIIPTSINNDLKSIDLNCIIDSENKTITLDVIDYYKQESDLNIAFVSKNVMNILTENHEFGKKFYAIVDDYDNLDNTIIKLDNIGFSSDIVNSLSNLELNNYFRLSKTINFGIYILYCLIIVILFVIIKYYMYDEKNNIAILKTLGYSTFIITFIMITRFLVLILISSIISICMYIINIFILSFFDFGSYNNFFQISYYDLYAFFNCLKTIIVLILFSMLTFYLKIKRIEPIVLFKD